MIYILIVGLIAGWATGKLMKGSGYGVLVDILLGIVGAFVGSRVLAMEFSPVAACLPVL